MEKLRQQFRFEECKPISTPVEAGFKFSYQDKGEPTDVLLYQQAVGCLIFLCKQPDNQYAVRNAQPWNKALASSQEGFLHLKGTMEKAIHLL